MKKMNIRFDWLTVTFKTSTIEDVLSKIFDLDVSLFTAIRGRYGYMRGLFYENVSVLFDGFTDDMGFCVEVSGKGCDLLYSDGFDWRDCFTLIGEFGGHITRLDVALDCFDHELDFDAMLQAVAVHNYSSRWRKVQAIQSFGEYSGVDIQFGSRRSDIMLRIYDKRAEQKRTDLDYWCRLELQLRNDLSASYVDSFMSHLYDIEEGLVDATMADCDHIFESYDNYLDACSRDLFLGVLNHYLRFINRCYDATNTNKCPTLPWWDSFIDSCRKAVILRHKRNISQKGMTFYV